MKKLILIVLLFTVFCPKSEAMLLTCKASGLTSSLDTWGIINTGAQYSNEQSAAVLVLDNLTANCVTSTGKPAGVAILGIGGGIRITNDYFTLSCPFISYRRMQKRKEINLTGLQASAAVIAGAKAGVFLNHRLGACALVGVQLGIGAAATISHLRIADTPEQADILSEWF